MPHLHSSPESDDDASRRIKVLDDLKLASMLTYKFFPNQL